MLCNLTTANRISSCFISLTDNTMVASMRSISTVQKYEYRESVTHADRVQNLFVRSQAWKAHAVRFGSQSATTSASRGAAGAEQSAGAGRPRPRCSTGRGSPPQAANDSVVPLTLERDHQKVGRCCFSSPFGSNFIKIWEDNSKINLRRTEE